MRQRLHQLIGLAFWVLLLVLWADLVLDGRAGFGSLRFAAQWMAIMGGTVLAVTVWWIRHNVAIHARKGPRAAHRVIAPRTDADRLGRPVHWSLPGGHEEALATGHLVVELRDGIKRYEAA